MLSANVNKSILLVLFFLTGCAVADMRNSESKTSALQAYPRSLSLGQSIHLTFPQQHPQNMAIRNPSGNWYSVQSSEEDILIIPTEKYNVATKLQLNTPDLKGITWINGSKVKEKVFQKYGEYLIYMANNLETEPENTFHFMVTVKLIKEEQKVQTRLKSLCYDSVIVCR